MLDESERGNEDGSHHIEDEKQEEQDEKLEG